MGDKTLAALRLREAARRASRPTVVVEATPYKELQAEAKDRGIPANQSREDLEKAIEEASEA